MRVSWLAPPVKPGATGGQPGRIVAPAHPPYVVNDPGAAFDDSGNAARQALYPWPLMPENQPQSQPDITSQQPYNLRNFRRLSPAFARLPIVQTPGGVGVDWLSLLMSLYDEALAHIDDKVNIVQQPFNLGAVATVVRPEESRRYLLIQNNSAANALFIGFGAAPSGAATDFQILAGQTVEFLKIPQNEIYFLGAGANTRGQILYAN